MKGQAEALIFLFLILLASGVFSPTLSFTNSYSELTFDQKVLSVLLLLACSPKQAMYLSFD